MTLVHPAVHSRADAVARHAGVHAPDGYARFCEAVAAMDLRPELRALKVPATVILGRHNPVVDEENPRLLADRGVVIELDAAHLANVQQPDAFVDVVAR